MIWSLSIFSFVSIKLVIENDLSHSVLVEHIVNKALSKISNFPDRL